MDGYGKAIAVSGENMFVGEPDNKYQPGAVYVYGKDAGQAWEQRAKITASDGASGDAFGSALAPDGDRLLVGAAGQGAAGAAYLFQKNGDTYEQVARLVPADTASGQRFGGGGVVLSGDWAAVGAPGAGASNQGAVYLFRQQGGGWQQVARLTGSGAPDGAYFGSALAFADGQLLIGAPGLDLAGRMSPDSTRGAAYLFMRDGDTWAEQAVLRAPSDGRGAAFGAAVSLHEGRAFVGVPRHGSAGAVMIFAPGDDGTYEVASQLHPFNGGQNAFFGMGIAHPDGETWVSAMGASEFAGGIYAFEMQDGAWQSSRSVVTGTGTRDLLGRTLAADGDVAAAGAIGVDNGLGAAVILERGASGDWSAQTTVTGDVGGLEAVRGEEVRCEGGVAARFDCDKMSLLSFTPTSQLGGGRGANLNDIWGWTDPETGTEYALVGRTDGMAFVDISNPQQPVLVGTLPMTEGANASSWRDMKVYDNHAFIVADNAGPHGMQVLDLTKLREYDGGEPITFEADALYEEVRSAHNMVINEDSGYGFIVGASGGGQTCGGGLHMVNIQDPTAPQFAGCFADPTTGRKGTGYSHDAQCIIYEGPDEEYKGREICFGSNETALSIADVTDKDDPKALAAAEYPNAAYTHQGWITEDQRYFFVNDELDELGGKTEETRTLIWDIADLDDPQLVKEYTFGTTSSDHNLYIKDGLMYQSNYASGLRVHDVSDPANPKEVAYFDTTPAGESTAGFTGTWSNYPYFESGVIAVSSIGEGLFLLKRQDPNL